GPEGRVQVVLGEFTFWMVPSVALQRKRNHAPDASEACTAMVTVGPCRVRNSALSAIVNNRHTIPIPVPRTTRFPFIMISSIREDGGTAPLQAKGCVELRW